MIIGNKIALREYTEATAESVSGRVARTANALSDRAIDARAVDARAIDSRLRR
jgi:hypothetical protein